MRYFFIALILGLTACSAYAQVSCNDFDVKSEVVGENLELKVTSDLPDDALINVSVSRRYWRKGSSRAYTFEYYSKELSMKELRQTKRLELSKAVLKKIIDSASEMSQLAGRSAITVDRLDNEVILRVALTMNQKNEDFGEHNKNLQGSAVRQIDAYRGVKVFRRISMGAAKKPKKKKAKKLAPSFKAAAFIGGGCYQLRENIELQNYFEGEQQTVGKAAKYDTVLIHRRMIVGEKIWYRVGTMTDTDAKEVSFGWVESSQFGRKKHREMDDQLIKEKLELKKWFVSVDAKLRYQCRGELNEMKRFEGYRVYEGVIVLDDGMTQENAERWALRAAWDLFEKHAANAIVLKIAREGDSIANAGTAWVLPESIAKPELLVPSVVKPDESSLVKGGTTILPTYFKKRPKSLPVGTEIYVKKEGSFEVFLYAGSTWKEGEKPQNRVAKGTSGVIEKVEFLQIGDKTVLRYFLKLEGAKTGWAPAEFVFKF